MDLSLNERLLDFLAAAPSCYHAVSQSCSRLEAAGFTRLNESAPWALQPGGAYYVTRSGSSVLAFRIGSVQEGYSFRITASHSDSPCLKLKPQPILEGGGYVRLNAERYGGMIYAPWLDRPLCIAGRVAVQTEQGVQMRLCHIDRGVALIPNLAPHMNREINKNYALTETADLVPLFSADGTEEDFWQMIADAAGCQPEDIVGHDLFLLPQGRGMIWGARQELISAPRLDDLQCAFATLQGFLDAGDSQGVSLWCCFDNEEVGSRTRQGAASTFLRDTLRRISAALGKTEEAHLRALDQSFALSADNAHAVHPNRPEFSDSGHRVTMGGGIVLKYSASQSYATDAVAGALVRTLCRREDIPVQVFANRSDLPGGSTLGNLSCAYVPVCTADIGLAQIAMHSCFETAGCRDTDYLYALAKAFYRTNITRPDPDTLQIL